MSVHDSPCYTVSLEVAVPAEAAFRFLCDLEKLGGWALGCFDTRRSGENNDLHQGTSLFDGSRNWVRVETDPNRFLVDYHVGDEETQAPRISARVVPWVLLERSPGTCIVSMTAWRTGGMSDDRWRRLCATHDAEIYLIREQLERSGGDISK